MQRLQTSISWAQSSNTKPFLRFGVSPFSFFIALRPLFSAKNAQHTQHNLAADRSLRSLAGLANVICLLASRKQCHIFIFRSLQAPPTAPSKQGGGGSVWRPAPLFFRFTWQKHFECIEALRASTLKPSLFCGLEGFQSGRVVWSCGGACCVTCCRRAVLAENRGGLALCTSPPLSTSAAPSQLPLLHHRSTPLQVCIPSQLRSSHTTQRFYEPSLIVSRALVLPFRKELQDRHDVVQTGLCSTAPRQVPGRSSSFLPCAIQHSRAPNWLLKHMLHGHLPCSSSDRSCLRWPASRATKGHLLFAPYRRPRSPC